MQIQYFELLPSRRQDHEINTLMNKLERPDTFTVSSQRQDISISEVRVISGIAVDHFMELKQQLALDSDIVLSAFF